MLRPPSGLMTAVPWIGDRGFSPQLSSYPTTPMSAFEEDGISAKVIVLQSGWSWNRSVCASPRAAFVSAGRVARAVIIRLRDKKVMVRPPRGCYAPPVLEHSLQCVGVELRPSFPETAGAWFPFGPP